MGVQDIEDQGIEDQGIEDLAALGMDRAGLHHLHHPLPEEDGSALARLRRHRRDEAMDIPEAVLAAVDISLLFLPQLAELLRP